MYVFTEMKRLTGISYSIFILAIVLSQSTAVFAAISDDCPTCKDIVELFHDGLKKTAKSNYGGGNTNWEEKSLGSFAHSEVRLVEIVDNLCTDSSNKKECHHMLEEYEEVLEKYWFTVYTKEEHTDFFEWFCIENTKVCCHNNTYGTDCADCTGGKERPCTGNGRCDGEGTRGGSGACRCTPGYQGELCNDCTDGYYEESRNDTHITCNACHVSCKSLCSGDGPKGCEECRDGWLTSEEEGCLDINECELGSPCEVNKYCTNIEGSFSCFSCDASCNGCMGAGSTKCVECKEGYEPDDSSACKDIDECSFEGMCPGDYKNCVNTEGSYTCQCEEGYIMEEDKCVPKPKDPYDITYEEEAESEEDEEDIDIQHEEL